MDGVRRYAIQESSCHATISVNAFLAANAGNYIVNFLASKGPKAPNFVAASLVQLLCRITKLGWYEDDRFKEIVKDATSFLSQVSMGLYMCIRGCGFSASCANDWLHSLCCSCLAGYRGALLSRAQSFRPISARDEPGEFKVQLLN